MQDLTTMNLDAMMKDIIDIFNLEGVELVRLSGLFFREKQLSNYEKLTPQELDTIVHKIKQKGLIDYQYILYCPHCYEVIYQIKDRENPLGAKVCDTCKGIFIPTKDISLFEYDKVQGI